MRWSSNSGNRDHKHFYGSQAAFDVKTYCALGISTADVAGTRICLALGAYICLAVPNIFVNPVLKVLQTKEQGK